jgi:enamine deaminase RidA (YjgF/YER057c/UK114 family)
MRRIVAAEYLSLDGVTEDPGPTEDFDRAGDDFEHAGWTLPYWNDELSELQSELLFASEALLLGRVTYEEFVASWPKRSGDPYTEKINSMPKFVASTTLKEPLEWNARLLEGDTVGEQALQAFRNLATILESEGQAWPTSCTGGSSWWRTSRDEGVAAFQQVWNPADPPPAITVHIVAGLNPGFLVEIDAVAVV